MNATIEVPRDDRLTELFAPEDKVLTRSSYTIDHSDGITRFSVTAKDAVSLRQSLGGITKLLSLWEQTKDL